MFTELRIADGWGEYHANQFRTHFHLPHRPGNPRSRLRNLAREFTRNFPRFFNGREYRMVKNVAEVREEGSRSFQGHRTLRFQVDMRIDSLNLDLFDLHSDWVAIDWQDPERGFAVQTLRREFAESSIEWASSTAAPLMRRLGGVLSPTMGAAGNLMELIIHYNCNHFLAGRRSWIFGLMDRGLPGWAGNATRGAHAPGVSDPGAVFFLETAAIERSSSFLYGLAEFDPGIIMDLRRKVVAIWTVLLFNYVQANGFELNAGRPTDWQHDDGDSLWREGSLEPSSFPSHPSFLIRPVGLMHLQGYWFRQGSFDSVQRLMSTQWIQYLFALHPSLRAQFDLPLVGR